MASANDHHAKRACGENRPRLIDSAAAPKKIEHAAKLLKAQSHLRGQRWVKREVEAVQHHDCCHYPDEPARPPEGRSTTSAPRHGSIAFCLAAAWSGESPHALVSARPTGNSVGHMEMF